MHYVARGDRVGFDVVRDEHAALYARWVNDPEVKVGIFNMGTYNADDERRVFVAGAQELAARREPQAVNFTIHDLADDAPVGTLGLFDISWRHRRGELGILLGERRGAGLGTDACRLMLDWAFHVLSLNSVLLGALDDNARAMRAYERAGFAVIGRRRESILSGGRLHDEVLMDALAGDWDGPSRVRATELDVG